jgi:chemotaxis protein MotB
MTQAAEERMAPGSLPVVTPVVAPPAVETSSAPALQIPAEVTKTTSGSGG